MHSLTFVLLAASAVRAALTDASLKSYPDVLSLGSSFNPVKAAYWTGLPHHRRTPFAVSPDGESAFIAYLDSSETDVHVQQVDPSTFAAVGTAVTVTGGKEAAGLVAQNDGFALLTNEALPTGTANAPADSTPVPVLYRFTNGAQSWKTFLGGPGVHASAGLSASPDVNGDLVYSAAAGLYGAYFVITDYSGDAAGHFGDSIQYVADDGTLKTISGASSSWGCSHNTGIAFEAADAAPFASICAEDQGAIWLNTKTQGMSNDGVKISNEFVINGASNEPMGGMSGSYSGLSRFIGSNSYIFSWVSRGAVDLTLNDWMGTGYTHATNRTNNRNVAIATFSDKYTLNGQQASSTVGAKSGDDQVNWITQGTADCSNAHVAAFDGSKALVTWEEIANPTCAFPAMGCSGTFSGTKFQLVDSTGAKVGDALTSNNIYVAGDMVTMSDGRICWPYVNMAWSLSSATTKVSNTQKMSFACMTPDGGATSSPAQSGSASTSAVASSAAVTTAVAQETSVAETTPVSPAPTSVAISQPAEGAEPTETQVATEDPTVTDAPSFTITDSVPTTTEVPVVTGAPSVTEEPTTQIQTSTNASEPVVPSPVPTASATNQPGSGVPTTRTGRAGPTSKVRGCKPKTTRVPLGTGPAGAFPTFTRTHRYNGPVYQGY